MTFATTSLRAQLRLWRDVVPPRPSGTSQAVSPDARGGSDAPHLGRTRRASVLRHRRARRQWSASVADLEAWSQEKPQPTAKTAHDRPGFVLGLNQTPINAPVWRLFSSPASPTALLRDKGKGQP